MKAGNVAERLKHVDPYSLACQPYRVMKANLLLTAPFALALSACDPTGASLDNTGIDPLRPPAGNVDTTDRGTVLRPGEFVSAAINNTAFYKAKPKEDQQADKLLSRGTPMKIIALSGNFTQVELDSGEVGFVPTVMISTGNAELTPLEGAPDSLVLSSTSMTRCPCRIWIPAPLLLWLRAACLRQTLPHQFPRLSSQPLNKHPFNQDD